jgi:hypothetical protein
VLYGLAMPQIFDQLVIKSRPPCWTRAGEFSKRVVPMNERAPRRGLDMLNLADRAIARGFVPPAPRAREMCSFARATASPLALCGDDPWGEILALHAILTRDASSSPSSTTLASRITNFCTLPVTVIGNASTNFT